VPIIRIGRPPVAHADEWRRLQLADCFQRGVIPDCLNREFRPRWPLAKIANTGYSVSLMRKFAMPTRNINLTAEQDAFIEQIVQAGRYQNASEAIRDAVRGLQQRLEVDELKLELLRTHIRAGLSALERGAFTEVDDAELDATLDDLAASAEQ
jgi:antitoxin ParD1/3/4